MISTNCACTLSRRAARALTRLYDEALLPSGLKVTQFSLLRTLQRTGELHISGLSAITGLERSTLGRNLRLLEAAGYVCLTGGRDRRERKIVLTGAGVDAIAVAMPLWQRAQERVAAGLGDDRQRLLFSLLDALMTVASVQHADESAHEGRGPA